MQPIDTGEYNLATLPPISGLFRVFGEEAEKNHVSSPNERHGVAPRRGVTENRYSSFQ